MFSAVENVRKVPCEKFGKVPPVGRCAKQLTSSRWILPSNRVMNVCEGIKKLGTISDIASLYKNGDLCFQS